MPLSVGRAAPPCGRASGAGVATHVAADRIAITGPMRDAWYAAPRDQWTAISGTRNDRPTLAVTSSPIVWMRRAASSA